MLKEVRGYEKGGEGNLVAVSAVEIFPFLKRTWQLQTSLNGWGHPGGFSDTSKQLHWKMNCFQSTTAASRSCSGEPNSFSRSLILNCFVDLSFSSFSESIYEMRCQLTEIPLPDLLELDTLLLRVQKNRGTGHWCTLRHHFRRCDSWSHTDIDFPQSHHYHRQCRKVETVQNRWKVLTSLLSLPGHVGWFVVFFCWHVLQVSLAGLNFNTHSQQHCLSSQCQCLLWVRVSHRTICQGF